MVSIYQIVISSSTFIISATASSKSPLYQFSKIESIRTPCKDNRQEPLDNRQEPLDNRQEPVDNRQEPVDNRQEPVDNRQEPLPL